MKRKTIKQIIDKNIDNYLVDNDCLERPINDYIVRILKRICREFKNEYCDKEACTDCVITKEINKIKG